MFFRKDIFIVKTGKVLLISLEKNCIINVIIFEEMNINEVPIKDENR